MLSLDVYTRDMKGATFSNAEVDLKKSTRAYVSAKRSTTRHLPGPERCKRRVCCRYHSSDATEGSHFEVINDSNMQATEERTNQRIIPKVP